MRHMTRDVNSPRKWDTNYETQTDGWDLGGPTPVFQGLIASQELLPGRMIVLGAGRGYDAREFARYGFAVTAVDFSSYAIHEMERLADPQAPIEILQSDIFALSHELDRSFDYVLEYVCFCAIDPTRRGEYADLVHRLLKSSGHFIDLAYPLDERKGGPPFAVSELEIMQLFTQRGFRLVLHEKRPESIERRRDAEKLFIFQK